MKKLIILGLLVVIYLQVFSQQKITGKVTDDNNDPLVGVNIVEKGTTHGTVTDVEGKYQLTVQTQNAVLLYSYIGFETKEVEVKDQTTIDVSLVKGIEISEVVVVGSRNTKRTITDSPVPIDVINLKELTVLGGRVDINQLLQYTAPSFNSTKQSGSDGADHIDPASLRGLGPDQVLVLINGKRQHQSSLINVFGTRGRGNTGTDMNAIPMSAIKRIEILRDGASAQYGSDAIAGVINIVLNDQTDVITGGISYGAYSTNVGGDYAKKIFDTQGGWEPLLFNIEGDNRLDGKTKKFDGNTAKLDLNYGAKLNDKGGFINIGSEILFKQRTLRPGFEWRTGYGSAAVDQYQFMANSVFPLSKNAEFYFFGGRGDRSTDAYAYTRGAPGIDGDDRTVAALYPNGFVPRITSKIYDNNFTGGFRFTNTKDWDIDFSHSYGSNLFHYYIKETNNASMGSSSPVNFDAGGHSLAMNVSNLDISKYYKDIMSGLNIGFGTEFRSESFRIFAGEEASYATYDNYGVAITNPNMQTPFMNEFGQQPVGGSQGFPGYSPENVVNENRTNFGFYTDIELNVTKDFMLGTALRFEDYSDFGNTFNYKLAARYSIGKNISLRASGSTGFRAPSLAQIHYNLVFNNIVGGTSLRTLLASNTSTVAKIFGIKPLKEETANNFSGGFTIKQKGFTATVDGYMIDVKNRIILTDIFDVSTLNVNAEAAQFFSNGVDTRTTGADVVINYKYDFSTNKANYLTLGLAGNFNKTKIERINADTLNPFTFFGPFSRAYLEAASPKYKIVGNIGYTYKKLNISLAYTMFSEVKIQDFQWVDTPATNQAEADALYAIATDVYKQAGTLDFSINYQINKNFSLTLGGNNLLNKYPTPQFDGWTDQGGFSDSVQMGSDGAYFFGKINFTF